MKDIFYGILSGYLVYIGILIYKHDGLIEFMRDVYAALLGIQQQMSLIGLMLSK